MLLALGMTRESGATGDAGCFGLLWSLAFDVPCFLFVFIIFLLLGTDFGKVRIVWNSCNRRIVVVIVVQGSEFRWFLR